MTHGGLGGHPAGDSAGELQGLGAPTENGPQALPVAEALSGAAVSDVCPPLATEASWGPNNVTGSSEQGCARVSGKRRPSELARGPAGRPLG